MVEPYALFLAACTSQGAAAAAVPAAMFALMPRIARPEQTGTFFGLIIAASVVGITLGRSAMGLLTAQVGLRAALLVCAGMLLAVAACMRALPADAGKPARNTGIVRLYADTARMLVAPHLRPSFASGFLLFFGYLGVVTFLTLRLHQPPFSFDSAAIGSISLLGIGAVLGAPLAGFLVGRIGALPVALGGMVVVLGAIACLAFAQSVLAVSIGVFLIFLGVFCCQPAVFVRIAQRVDASRRGAASSLYLLTCLGAGSLASVVLGPVWLSVGWQGVTTVCAAAIGLGMAVLLAGEFRARQGRPVEAG